MSPFLLNSVQAVIESPTNSTESCYDVMKQIKRLDSSQHHPIQAVGLHEKMMIDHDYGHQLEMANAREKIKPQSVGTPETILKRHGFHEDHGE